MNNRFFTRLVVLVGLLLGLWMCSKEPCVLPQTPQEPLYSVAKARAYYDGASCTTRTIVEPGPLTPGDYLLDWERAEVSLDSLLSSVDVPIDMQYRYYRYLQPEPDSVELVPIYSKLVVVKEHPTLLEGCYIRYVMPARSMRSAYPDYDYDALLNSRPKTDFTGVSLYTDLNGWPMCMAYYYEGELLFDAFLFDKAHTLEENVERLYNLIGDLTVARCSQAETRGTDTNQDDETPKDGGGIEEVVIVAKRPSNGDPFEDEQPFPELPDPVLPEFGGGGGSGPSSGNNGNSDSGDNSSKHNDKIKFEDEETEEVVEPLLDSISQDCMGQTLLAALDGVTIKTGTGRNGYNSATNTIELSPHKMYGYRDYVLLEELIHRYQYQQGYTTQCIEKEVEAKVGWVLYLERSGRHLTRSQANAQLGHSTKGVITLAACYADFNMGYGYPAFDISYQETINHLRPLYPENQYPFIGITSLQTFENLQSLSINCPPL
ncbi:MAG: hypothetical protein IKU77_05980 [Alistipes sp.]|nr:hypothetical protein [Alistipes sp.]